ncbi:MAG: DUF2147 domain-containing protein [Betaproteobacteria bacterium]|nr:DUF2147 domain-containing protein [Betaproteobacteria bacterium]
MSRIWCVVVGSVLSCLVSVTQAADLTSPVGLWKTVDDHTHKARSLVRIVEVGGELQGRVEELLNRQPDDDPDGLCRKCPGERKDQPIVGMTILWGLKRDDDEYDGGEILDPKNGKTYRCKMHVIDGGRRLEVRGYIGISLIGRTQTWVRVE